MKFNARTLCLLLAPIAMSAWAEDTPSDTPAVNPQVVDKLVQMGDHLRSLSKFRVDADVTRDTVLESGQKIKSQAVTTLLAEGGNRLYARIESDTQTREFFYNGKKLTQYSPYMKYYTTVDAPDNTQDTLHRIEDHYGLQVPLEDLFLLGRDQDSIDALSSALYVGPSTIKGKLCDHLAFRQTGIDWQLWVTRSDKPLPCKLVITSTDQASFPEYSAVYSWNLKPVPKASNFTFTPGKGDVAIPFKKAAE
ncbi:DUF2092 domain-containing protein [Pseudomonas sp. LS1212]|uniref:DUF2092 domain-containing protein n=1 Tax=Pseudomonas sp. LS1212 TaxID=2972478 RepID=UPI00215D1F1F|nr:DUF2092 domain-containing protein [Pseudomonas sp. LS1212]UVJ41775.1 DUF2092 domain-containing protein [Pseudomonas sp. LS1212]